MDCQICGMKGVSLIKVRHRDRGCVKVCSGCYEREWERILPATGGCSCWGG
ncbi:MAG: hypothetical protein JW986_00635 [Methanotrichaceae archaeon]|nr:hypothetical protein [Methanotrichaceae archaeon]